MMPECDLDENDPLSAYLKRAPMIGAKVNVNKKPVSSCICCLGVPLPIRDGYKFDSITSVRQCHENINQNEIDNESDKAEVSDVSK
jgi:hypothetical protein